MAQQESFYLTLSSNVKPIGEHSKNTIGNFITYLPSKIDLVGEWVVGLCEIQYSNSWYNLKQNNYVNLVLMDNQKVTEEMPYFIPPGRYTNLTKLLRQVSYLTPVSSHDDDDDDEIIFDEEESAEIRLPDTQPPIAEPPAPQPGLFGGGFKFLGVDESGKGTEGSTDADKTIKERKETIATKFKNPPYLEHNPITHRIIIRKGKIKTDDSDIHTKFVFSPELAAVMGTDDGTREGKDNRGEYLEGIRPYDLNAGVHNLYVYSDVVEFSTVGDARAQLLRVVSIPNQIAFGENVYLTYDKPYYNRVASRTLQSIEIDIKDDTGTPVKFMFGRVIVVLHFQRVG